MINKKHGVHKENTSTLIKELEYISRTDFIIFLPPNRKEILITIKKSKTIW